MPTFSSQHALGKLDEMRSSLASALRGMFLLALPASVGLIMLARPIVSMLYQRGKFDATVAEMTAWALTWYAAGLIGHSIMEVLTRAFYAQHDTRTPVLIGTAAMLLNVIFSVAFSRLFAQIGWFPHGGLALANSLATALEATALFVVMRKRLNGIQGTFIAQGFAASAAAVTAMALGIFGWMQLADQWGTWLSALGGIVVGGGVYALAIGLLRVPEFAYVLQSLKRRLAR